MSKPHKIPIHCIHLHHCTHINRNIIIIDESIIFQNKIVFLLIKYNKSATNHTVETIGIYSKYLTVLQ